MSFTVARSAVAQPEKSPSASDVPAGSRNTSGAPATPAWPGWMWAAITGMVRFSEVTSKQISPRPGFIVKETVPEPSGSPGPGTSCAPVISAESGRPPAEAGNANATTTSIAEIVRHNTPSRLMRDPSFRTRALTSPLTVYGRPTEPVHTRSIARMETENRSRSDNPPRPDQGGRSILRVGAQSEGEPMIENGSGKSDGRRLGSGAIASLVGVGFLVTFMLQNTEDVRLDFLVWHFTWPLWLVTMASAVLGALVWFGV